MIGNDTKSYFFSISMYCKNINAKLKNNNGWKFRMCN